MKIKSVDLDILGLSCVLMETSRGQVDVCGQDRAGHTNTGVVSV